MGLRQYRVRFVCSDSFEVSYSCVTATMLAISDVPSPQTAFFRCFTNTIFPKDVFMNGNRKGLKTYWRFGSSRILRSPPYTHTPHPCCRCCSTMINECTNWEESACVSHRCHSAVSVLTPEHCDPRLLQSNGMLPANRNVLMVLYDLHQARFPGDSLSPSPAPIPPA